ncbi:nuclease [Halomonas aestuarii]|uniref:Nuclease n=1 Tax=Halomonas aestuarii TaxID=1897729 RepID=A0A1J0VIW1_9GAMM|nr:NYN domain-containing protein [Halomonas aestuarii]APE31953.1 nuclease [Halomonas aestuarii]
MVAASRQADRERVALLVDVQNVYYTTRQAFGRHFNYHAFWASFAAGREVCVANAYAIDRGDPKQRQFQDILRGIGFEVKLKPYIQRSDGSAKGDWDVGIALDAMEAAPLVDRVVLVSGDGDFDLLVERMRERHGVTVEVVGVERLTADSLIRAASHFVPIEGELLL